LPTPFRLVSFPVEFLPEPIGKFSTACAASLSAPVELVAIPALVVAASAIGNSRVISLKQGWIEPAIFFAAVVSQSGTMKSPALQQAAEPLQGLDTPGRRTWTADVTVERLAGLLAENPRGLLLLRDELSAWVKSMNQYKQGKGSDRQFYLSVWGGAPHKGDRKRDSEAISIPRPYLSVVGCIPPAVIPDLDDLEQEDGFLPRLLFAWPRPVPVRWTERVVPQEVREAYANRIKKLFAIPMESEPVSLALTSEAHSRFTQWHDRHCAETEDASLPPFLRGVYAKLKGYCPRLALVHALVSNPSADKVERVSVDSAIALVDYFKAQAWRVMPLLGQGKTSEVDRCKGEIRRKLSVCRFLKKRDVQKNSAFDANEWNQAFSEMCSPEIEQHSDGTISLQVPTNRQGVAPRTRVGEATSSSSNPPISESLVVSEASDTSEHQDSGSADQVSLQSTQ